jgi:hypothetical protein
MLKVLADDCNLVQLFLYTPSIFRNAGKKNQIMEDGGEQLPS